ncbi:Excinuclease ABC subunit C [hydrothermal vent metagenome]|uniref:Excinuclease ABC subunit C n=1 Tax=hydrothermal vent metagenome TaxID=652676 RepID=A0A3B0VFL1_9ZZZZ
MQSKSGSHSENPIEEKIKRLPASPGVYLMKKGRAILYIGKAKNLRSRVRSYFRKSGDTRYAVRFLSSKVDDIDVIVTANETEALILEDTLLKQHRPRYNIRLKDDKTYVSIKITMAERFPRILVGRRVRDDGARYFGPYASAREVRGIVKFIRRLFPLCVCSPHEFRNRVRPCLDHQMGLCAAPATGAISQADYAALVGGAVMFLEGKNKELLRGLKKEMQEAAKGHEYERAAVLRDRIRSIEDILEEQKVVSLDGTDQDIFGLQRGTGEAGAESAEGKEGGNDGEASETMAIVALFIRGGRLVGTRDFIFPDNGVEGPEIMSSFLGQFYRKSGAFIPVEVFTSERLSDAGVIAGWLGERKGRKVMVKRPLRGAKLGLVEMALANAREALAKSRSLREDASIIALKDRLRLAELPRVIEAFDISNLGSTEAVGAMVCFSDGQPAKERYRKYKMRTEGPDDYAMMEELLSRRYKDDRLPLPALILIDGGKGQLGVACKVMAGLGIKGVELASLAKEKAALPRGGSHATGKEKPGTGERVYRPGRKDPIYLKEGSKGDLLLRRVRDEVHRFAITYHRGLRGKAAVRSVLDEVAGVGKERRRQLFERFGDIEGIKGASLEELEALPGISGKVAMAIKKKLE